MKAWGVGAAVGVTEVWFVNPINFVKFRMQRPEWGYKVLNTPDSPPSPPSGFAVRWSVVEPDDA